MAAGTHWCFAINQRKPATGLRKGIKRFSTTKTMLQMDISVSEGFEGKLCKDLVDMNISPGPKGRTKYHLIKLYRLIISCKRP